MILSLERRLALTPSVASLQTLTFEILRSVSRRRAAPPKPHLGDGAGGAGSRGAPGPEINAQYRSNGARMPVLSG